MIRRLTCGIMALLALASCASTPPVETTALGAAPFIVSGNLPRFSTRIRSGDVPRANSQIAQDFLDLTFQLENGRTRKSLLKFEGAVGVKFYGTFSQDFRPEIADLFTRLQREAQIPINETTNIETARIHVHAIPHSEISAFFPRAACFVVPGVKTVHELTSAGPSTSESRWSALKRLDFMSVFLPSDRSHQEIRECLHEEIAQALGPANDLFRLASSIFNDDNNHAVLTPFDMLILRALYSPELRSGMQRGEVALLLPDLLSRLNPIGDSIAPKPRNLKDASWKSAILKTLDRRRNDDVRRSAGIRAVRLARKMQPVDHRLGFSLLRLAAINRKTGDPTTALYKEAYQLHRALLGPQDIRTAQSATHIGIQALRKKDFASALTLANAHIDTARNAEHAGILASLLHIRARALFGFRKVALGRDTQLESLAWKRYALGDKDGKIADSEARTAAIKIPLASRLEPAE